MMVMALAERCRQTAQPAEPTTLSIYEKDLVAGCILDGGDASLNLNECVSATTGGCQDHDGAESGSEDDVVEKGINKYCWSCQQLVSSNTLNGQLVCAFRLDPVTFFKVFEVAFGSVSSSETEFCLVMEGVVERAGAKHMFFCWVAMRKVAWPMMAHILSSFEGDL